jgi:hypothetical protein
MTWYTVVPVQLVFYTIGVVKYVVTETIETKLFKNGMLKVKNNAVRTRISALSLCSKLNTVKNVSVTTGT